MQQSPLRISVFGLGYVGSVTAACLANDGHDVTTIDVSAEKVDALNAGHSPIVEPGLAALVAAMVATGRLRATADAAAARDTDLSFICVGTPANSHHSFDLDALLRVGRSLGAILRDTTRRHTVAVRSTLMPGDTERVVIPLLESTSGKRAGYDFGVCYHPEFLREGSALRDFTEPSRILIGDNDVAAGDVVAALYQRFQLPVVRTSIRSAEMIKLADNALHALKVTFANEVGRLCKATGVDSHLVMAALADDGRKQAAPTYLEPGFAFGGACLPKDLRALQGLAANHQRDVPLLNAIGASNDLHKQTALDLIHRNRHKRIGVLGLSFKVDTDDLRDSPAVELVARLLDDGYEVLIFDPNIVPDHLLGANRAYAERVLPTLAAQCRESLDEVVHWADLLIITQRNPLFAEVLDRLRSDQNVLDLVRIRDDTSQLGARYDGLCW